jgi:hypothetical protein
MHPADDTRVSEARPRLARCPAGQHPPLLAGQEREAEAG